MLYVDHINLLLFLFQTHPDTILSPQDNNNQGEVSALFHSSRRTTKTTIIRERCLLCFTPADVLRRQQRSGRGVCFVSLQQTYYKANIDQEVMSVVFHSSRRTTKTRLSTYISKSLIKKETSLNNTCVYYRCN